jgi:hypothetical protein
MVELEKRGIPTVSWVAPGFIEDAKMSGQVFGAKSLALAILSHEPAYELREQVREMVSQSIDQVIEGLTKPVTTTKAETALTSEILTIQGTDLLEATEKMNRYFLDKGWSDGFPLVPPTAKAVESMLTGTRLDRHKVIGILEPGNGIATVEKIAINAVMAGCRPEHMPVIITAVRCITDPSLFLREMVMSTGAQGPLILVNGPIAKKLNINSKSCAMDPGSGSYANIVIGRALSLILMNIAQGYPGVMSMSTTGSPHNYSLCVAENEEESPWEPYHVEKGFDRDTSTVTVIFVRGGNTFGDTISNTAEEVARGMSWVASRANVTLGMWLLSREGEPGYETRPQSNMVFLLGQSHARVLARDGWDKKTLRQYLHDHVKLPLDALMYGKEPSLIIKHHRELVMSLKDHPEVLLPVLASSEHFLIARVGGGGPVSAFFEGHGGTVTLPIEE